MEETYKIKAIILDRQPFRESDLGVTIYSAERGRLNLVARGARKAGSKLAGHLEPINLVDIMAIKGRNFDYVGSAQSENIFKGIKKDLRKIVLAGKAIRFFKKTVKENEPDKNLFDQLLNFLNLIEGLKGGEIRHDIFFSFFILKLTSSLGHAPELYNCVKCGAKIISGSNGFDSVKGGILCGECNNKKLTISDNCIKILRIVISSDFLQLKKIIIKETQEKELLKTINSFVDYCIS